MPLDRELNANVAQGIRSKTSEVGTNADLVYRAPPRCWGPALGIFFYFSFSDLSPQCLQNVTRYLYFRFIYDIGVWDQF